MTVDRYLRQYLNIETDLYIKNVELTNARLQCYGISAIQTGDKVDTSASNQQIIRPATDIVEIEEEILRMTAKQNEIKSRIREIDDRNERRILFGIYIEGKSLARVAKEIGYCRKQTYNINKKAQEKFAIKYNLQ